MNKGLSNFEIDKFFKDEENEEIKKNYMGVYSMDSITRYINFYEIIKRKNGKYPFAIFNTDKHDKPGMHWWSFMGIHPKKNLFLFDGLGIDGFKFFIVDNDGKIINQLHHDFKKCEPKSNQKLKLCAMNFCVETWQKMSHKVKDQPADTAQNFFYLLEQFAKLKKTECMNILTLENDVEDLLGSACGLFLLYFYKYLFNPDEKSKILDHENVNKKTLETIIHEIFSTDVDENEHIIKSFREEYDLYFIYICIFLYFRNKKSKKYE